MQTDDGGLLSDIPPADERKSLADFLKPRRSSRPPSLAEFLRPSARPKSILPGQHPVSLVPPATEPGPETIELPAPDPAPRPSLFSELPVPRGTRLSDIPRAPALPGDAERRGSIKPGASVAPSPAHDESAHDSQPRLAVSRLPVTDEVELAAELTSTRHWLEARRSSQAHAQLGEVAPLPRHTAEPVWNADDPETATEAVLDEHPEPVAGLAGWTRQPGRYGAALAIVAGAALLTVFVISRAHRAPAPRAVAAELPIVSSAAQPDNIPEPPAALDEQASPSDPTALRRQARELLTAGHVQEGVRVARQLIELDPRDSEAYILLAAGLQDLGRWRESRELFERCTHLARGADTAECVYFARRAQ